jgi:arylsulfatase A-like enzyme
MPEQIEKLSESALLLPRTSLPEKDNGGIVGHAKKYILIASITIAATCGAIFLVAFKGNQNAFTLLGSKSSSAPHTDKPNFVFILSDDLAWASLGYVNTNLSYVTPEISAMAADGIKLTNYYAMESCNPSRAALLTGRYPVNMGMQYGVIDYDTEWGLRLEETLLPEILADSGYTSYMFGKWHLGHFNERYLPTARGFDYYTGYLDGQNEYFSKRDPSIMSDDAVKMRDFLTMDSSCYYGYDGPNLHNYSTHLYRDLAVETIMKHDQSKPMFMYLSFQAVHIPFSDEDGREVDTSYMNAEVYDKIMSTISVSGLVCLGLNYSCRLARLAL